MFGFDLSKPDFVNDDGVKWWLDKNLTEYAQQSDIHGISLPDVKGWLCELKGGERSYVLTDNDGVIEESKSLEGIGFIVDKLKLIKSLNK